MLDLRSPLIVGAGPAGLALAAVTWFLLGGGHAMTTDLDGLDAKLAAIKPRAAHVSTASSDLSAHLASTPLFALTTGPGAVAETTVQLQGLAITPVRKAALISIGGKPSDWLELGATRDGVTLMAMQSSKVTVDTATGFKDVALWDGASSATPTTNAHISSAPGRIPAGTHLPPPPASAPGQGG